MENLVGWLLTFFLLVSHLSIVGYQLICCADLEFDYYNFYDSITRINTVVMPEFVAQAVFCLACLLTGHFYMFFLSLPNLYYNSRLYRRKRHMIDVTEIFNQLNWEKRQRLFKLAYNLILLVLFIFRLLSTMGDDDY